MMINTNLKRSCLIRFFRQAAAIFLVFIVGFFPFTANAFDLLIGTGAPGTFSHFTGRSICRIINRHSGDINCKAVPAPNDVHNLTNLQGGSLDVGLIDSRMLYDAMNKTGYFVFLDIDYDNLRVLFPLYDIPVTLVVRNDAGIQSLNGLKGKRINAGAPGSLRQLAVNTILKAKNWSKSDFSLITELPASQSQDTMAFCHGTIQAMVHIGIHPDSALQQLFRLCKADLVDMNDNDIEKLVADHAAFTLINIAAGTYPSQPNAVATFGTKAMLVASEDLDEQAVYRIIDAIYSNRKDLKRAHPALSPIAVGDAKKHAAGMQLHPGAVKYITEHGM